MAIVVKKVPVSFL